MRKTEVKKAIAEHWRVKDDFGSSATVTGPGETEELLKVRFDRTEHDAEVHYRRVNRLWEGG